MYLPKEQIVPCCKNAGWIFWMECSFLRVQGAKASSGKLFKLFCSKLPCPGGSLVCGDSPARICRGSAGGYPLLFAAAANPRCHTPKPRDAVGGVALHLAKLLPESKSQCCAGGRAAWPAGGCFATWLHGQRAVYRGKACIPGAGYVPGAPGCTSCCTQKKKPFT